MCIRLSSKWRTKYKTKGIVTKHIMWWVIVIVWITESLGWHREWLDNIGYSLWVVSFYPPLFCIKPQSICLFSVCYCIASFIVPGSNKSFILSVCLWKCEYKIFWYIMIIVNWIGVKNLDWHCNNSTIHKYLTCNWYESSSELQRLHIVAHTSVTCFAIPVHLMWMGNILSFKRNRIVTRWFSFRNLFRTEHTMSCVITRHPYSMLHVTMWHPSHP